jgi:hypothetical protein
MAYRKAFGSSDFYLSGDPTEMALKHAYAWAECLDPAPMEAQQVAA